MRAFPNASGAETCSSGCSDVDTSEDKGEEGDDEEMTTETDDSWTEVSSTKAPASTFAGEPSSSSADDIGNLAEVRTKKELKKQKEKGRRERRAEEKKSKNTGNLAPVAEEPATPRPPAPEPDATPPNPGSAVAYQGAGGEAEGKGKQTKSKGIGKGDLVDGLALCFSCQQRKFKWRHCQESWTKTAFDADSSDDDSWVRLYKCRECLSTELGISEAEAASKIARERPSWTRVERRAEKFAENFSRIREVNMCLSNREVKKITLRSIAQVFEPLQAAVLKKLVMMKKRDVLVGQWREAADKLAAAKTTKELVEAIAKLDQLEDSAHTADRPIGFSSKQQDQWRWWNASTYADCWSEVRSGGQVIGSFMSWFICRAGGDSPCGTLIPSRKWSTFQQDLLASKQRWYCVSCGARYKTKFGMLVQLQLVGEGMTPGEKYFALADVPDDVMDIKAIDLESRLGDLAQTPEEMMSMIPEVAPSPCELLRPIRAEELSLGWRGFTNMDVRDHTGIFKIVGLQQLAAFPRWEWNQIYHFALTDAQKASA